LTVANIYKIKLLTLSQCFFYWLTVAGSSGITGSSNPVGGAGICGFDIVVMLFIFKVK
jgi:hypothetical protein